MESPIVLAVPSRLPLVPPVATVEATQPIATIPAVLTGISTHAPHILVLHIPVPVPSDALSTATASSAPAVSMASSSALLASASVQVSSALNVARQSSLAPAIINRQSSVPELEVSNISPLKPVVALLRKRLARREANSAKQDEGLIARLDCILK